MRLYLKLSPSTHPIDFNYQSKLTGILHKWLGKNQLHDDMSLYSFSWLSDATCKNGALYFPNGSEWFISYWENSFGLNIYEGIKKDQMTIAGMEVTEITIAKDPPLKKRVLFYTASPILIRNFEDNNYKHFTYTDEGAGELLTRILCKKLERAKIVHNDFEIKFDLTYNKAKTKLIDIHGIRNRASECPIKIYGDEIVKKFAWNVGVGHSSGSGFGALK